MKTFRFYAVAIIFALTTQACVAGPSHGLFDKLRSLSGIEAPAMSLDIKKAAQRECNYGHGLFYCDATDVCCNEHGVNFCCPGNTYCTSSGSCRGR